MHFPPSRSHNCQAQTECTSCDHLFSLSLSCWPAGSERADLLWIVHCWVTHIYHGTWHGVGGLYIYVERHVPESTHDQRNGGGHTGVIGAQRYKSVWSRGGSLEQKDIRPAGLWKASNTRPESCNLILPAAGSHWRFWSRRVKWTEINWWHFKATHHWKGDWWNCTFYLLWLLGKCISTSQALLVLSVMGNLSKQRRNEEAELDSFS